VADYSIKDICSGKLEATRERKFIVFNVLKTNLINSSRKAAKELIHELH